MNNIMLFVDDCHNGCWIVMCSECGHQYHTRTTASVNDKCPCCNAPNLYPEGASW